MPQSLATLILLLISYAASATTNPALQQEFRKYQQALRKEQKTTAPKNVQDSDYRIRYILDSCTQAKWSKAYPGDAYGYPIHSDVTFINPFDKDFDRKKPGTKTEVYYASGKKVVYYSGFKSGSCKVLVYFMEKKSTADLRHDSIARAVQLQLDTADKHIGIIMNSGEGSNVSGGKNLDQWNAFRENTKPVLDSILLTRQDLFWSHIYVTLANGLIQGEQEPKAEQQFYNRFMYTASDSLYLAQQQVYGATDGRPYTCIPGDGQGGTFEEIKLAFEGMRNEQTAVFYVPYPAGVVLIISNTISDPETEQRGHHDMVIWFGR